MITHFRFSNAISMTALMILMLAGTLFARPDKLLDNSRYDLIRLDTLGYKEIYIPKDLKYDFPYDVTGSRAIKDAYKAAKEEGDGYMIYMLSILEWENVFTYGNLNAGKMLFEAFNIAETNGDARLTLYVLAQQMRFNLFSIWYPVDFFRHAADIATAVQDPTALLEIADYAEDMKYEEPDPVKLRALAYGIMDKVQIRDEEFEVYWDDFSHFCKNMDANDVDRYINTELTVDRLYFEEAYFHRDYTRREIANILTNKDDINNPLPEWETEMDSLSTARPLIRRNLGDSGAISWSISPAYEDPDHEFNYRINHDGPVSFTTAYYFKKFDGRIKLFKIVYDEY